MLLIAMLAALSISIFTFVFLMIRAARRQMYLCAVLIKQMEATQQAERKSMNKSFAFASASHDIRASLAGLIGLIELCHGDVSPHSELETNLSQMEGCVNDLLGILSPTFLFLLLFPPLLGKLGTILCLKRLDVHNLSPIHFISKQKIKIS